MIFSPEYIKFTSRVISHWRNVAQEWATYHNLDLERYIKLVTAKLMSIVIECDIYVRVSNAETLNEVLSLRRFKTGFEQGGLYGLHPLRAVAENLVLGIPTTTVKSERPIYGYLGAKNSSEVFSPTESQVDEYGAIVIRMKDYIRERTTFCIGDSIVKSGAKKFGQVMPFIQATPINNPEYFSFLPDEDHLYYLRNRQTLQYRWYLEAHIRGVVSISDIREVIFRKDEPTDKSLEMLAASNIPFSFR